MKTSHFKTLLLVAMIFPTASYADAVAGSAAPVVLPATGTATAGTSISGAPLVAPITPAKAWPTPGQAATSNLNPVVVPARTLAPPVSPLATPPPTPQQNTTPQLISGLISAMSAIGKSGGKGTAGAANGSASSSSTGGNSSQVAVSGNLDPCGSVPSEVQSAQKEAMAYRQNCAYANKGDNQKIVINDYNVSPPDMPYMYIFSSQGQCLGKTPVTYGNGKGKVKPMACNDNGSHLTPPGFFLTCQHASASFPAGQSLGMCGLEGQNSQGRGILIHPSGAPGQAVSWGCSGVGCFGTVKQLLGEGSLVYNYFGSNGAASGCRNTNGLGTHSRCVLDPGASVPATATGSNASPGIK